LQRRCEVVELSASIVATAFRGKLGAVIVTGSIRGGGGVDSGQIVGLGAMASVAIGGSVIGGGGLRSGLFASNGSI